MRTNSVYEEFIKSSGWWAVYGF